MKLSEYFIKQGTGMLS